MTTTITPENIASRLDAELVPTFTAAPPPPPAAPDVPGRRALLHQVQVQLGAALGPCDDVRITDLEAPSASAPPVPVPVRVYAPRQRQSGAVLMWIHGGGFFAGHHQDEAMAVVPWVRELGCTVVSVGYRRSPEARHPAAIDDCTTVLNWLACSAQPLGFRPAKLAVGGISAGGCLAAATALKARDSGGPALCFQLLLIPCIDSRSATPSMHEVADTRTWNRASNLAAWEMYAGPGFLGELSPYAAPGRATDLSGLPPAYLEVAEIDPLRDEAIDYASRLMRAGVRTELHVYPGAYHGSTYFQPGAEVSRRSKADTLAALRRAFA